MAVLQPGVRLKGGTYEIISLLGQGGCGEVYLARQARVERDVAIKVLLPSISADQSMVTRFQGEALAAGSLVHPNVLTVFDFDFEEALGVWFLALQYIPGGRTLRSVLGAPLPLGDVIHYVEAIAGALDAAHARNIVHRDVKPENVLLQVDDQSQSVRPLLADFGIARLRTSGLHTATGTIIGTLEYMSPEQGRGKEIGPASDQYALGIMAYEMLGGRRPFMGDPVLLLQHANESPPPLTTLNPSVNAATRAAVLLALTKAPEERFATCTEFAQALRVASGWATSPPIENLGSPVPSSPSQARPAATPAQQAPVPSQPRAEAVLDRPAPPTSGERNGDARAAESPGSDKRLETGDAPPGSPVPGRASPTLLDAVDDDRVESTPAAPQAQIVLAEPGEQQEEPRSGDAPVAAKVPSGRPDAASPVAAAAGPATENVSAARGAVSAVDTGGRPQTNRVLRIAALVLVPLVLGVLLLYGARGMAARSSALPPSSEAGLFALESHPVADVVLDGTTVGKTPLELRLAAGTSHEIALRAATYRDYTWSVQVEGGVRRPLVVTLEPLPAVDLLVPYTAPELAPKVGHTLFKDAEGINRLDIGTDRFLRSDGVGAVVYLENRAFGVRELTYTAVARWYVAANEADGRPWREEVQQQTVPPSSKIWDQAFCLPGFLLDAAGSGTPLRLEFLVDGSPAAVLHFRVEGGDPGAFVRSKCEVVPRLRAT